MTGARTSAVVEAAFKERFGGVGIVVLEVTNDAEAAIGACENARLEHRRALVAHALFGRRPF